MSHIEIDSIEDLSTERLNELIEEGRSAGTSTLGPAHKKLYDAMVEEVKSRVSGGLELPADALNTGVDESEDATEEKEITEADQWGRDPVPFDNSGLTYQGSADAAERGGTLRPSTGADKYMSFSDAFDQLSIIRTAGLVNPTKKDAEFYKTFDKNLKILSGSDYESQAGQEAAFTGLLEAAGEKGNVMELMEKLAAADPYGKAGSSGSGKYKGPVTTTSSTITDEISAKALLNNYARDLIGRDLNDKEVEKYVKQFNRLETENPQVSLSTPGVGRASSVTNTPASKEELLRQVVSSNPDYAKFQIDTTIMDMLLDDIEKGKAVING